MLISAKKIAALERENRYYKMEANFADGDSILSVFYVSLADLAWLIIFALGMGAIAPDKIFSPSKKIKIVEDADSISTRPPVITMLSSGQYVLGKTVYTEKELLARIKELKSENLLGNNFVLSHDDAIPRYDSLKKKLNDLGFKVIGWDHNGQHKD